MRICFLLIRGSLDSVVVVSASVTYGERSFAELTEAALKVNTGVNFTLSFAPTLTTKLIFENSGSSDILLQAISASWTDST